jgi:hypothetical protein
MKELTIRLGDDDYVIRRLTLRQIQDLGLAQAHRNDVAAVALTSEEKEQAGYDAMVNSIASALSRTAKPLTRDEVLDIEGLDLAQLAAASMAIYIFSGLVPSDVAAKSGEALAVES